MTYNDNNQLTSYNSTTDANDLSYTYDDDGNRITKTGGQDVTYYEYNDAGKLVCITYPDEDVEEFLYDGDGMRKMHRPKGDGSAAWVRFTEWGSIWDENLEPPEEIFNYLGVEIFHDTYGETDSRYHMYSDYIGSVRQIVTDATNPADDSRFDYSAYGLNDSEKDYSSMSFGAKSPSKFVGDAGYYDGSGRDSSNETADGMTLCGQRWYDPQIGRWLTEDPIGFDGGLNLYAYCGNRPTSSIDPCGAFGVDYGIHDGSVWHHVYDPDTETHSYYPVTHDKWPADPPKDWPTRPNGPRLAPNPMTGLSEPLPSDQWQIVTPLPTPSAPKEPDPDIKLTVTPKIKIHWVEASAYAWGVGAEAALESALTKAGVETSATVGAGAGVGLEVEVKEEATWRAVARLMIQMVRNFNLGMPLPPTK